MPDSAPETTRNAVARYCQQPLVAAAVALATGITLDRYWSIPIGAWFAGGATAVIAWLLARRSLSPSAHLLSSIALLVGVAAFGGALHHWHWHMFPDRRHWAPRANRSISSRGRGDRDFRTSFPRPPPPDPLRSVPQGPRTDLRIEITAVRDGDTWQPASGKARLRVDGQLTGVHAGDTLRVFGQLVRPESPGNPGEFDFAEHHRADRELADLRCDSPNGVTRFSPQLRASTGGERSAICASPAIASSAMQSLQNVKAWPPPSSSARASGWTTSSPMTCSSPEQST